MWFPLEENAAWRFVSSSFAVVCYDKQHLWKGLQSFRVNEQQLGN